MFPAILLLFFVVIQGAMWFHARNVALAAAREGLRAAASENGSATAGATQAQQFIDQAGGTKVITGVSVVPVRTVTQASVTVVGTSISLIPGIGGFSVSQTASGTVERTTIPGQP